MADINWHDLGDYRVTGTKSMAGLERQLGKLITDIAMSAHKGHTAWTFNFIVPPFHQGIAEAVLSIALKDTKRYAVIYKLSKPGVCDVYVADDEDVLKKHLKYVEECKSLMRNPSAPCTPLQPPSSSSPPSSGH
jgi:hypothetical protein